MASVQVAALKAFLVESGRPCLARHYYKAIDAYVDPETSHEIHRTLVGEHFFGALLFPEARPAIERYVAERTDGQVNVSEVIDSVEAYAKEIADRVVGEEFGLLALTTTHMQFFASVYVSKLVKERRPDVKVVFGGLTLAEQAAQNALTEFPWLDFVIEGEGERPLLRLLEALDGELPLDAVPQLIHKIGDRVLRNGRRELVPCLDDLPYPDYSDYYTEEVDRSRRIVRNGDSSLVIDGSRGCRWGRCSFCIEGLPSRKGYRAKSAERLRDEILDYSSTYGVLEFVFSDPDVAFHRELFPLLADIPYDVTFSAELTGFISPAQLETMARAGFHLVQIGIESFSPEMLKKFRKGVRLIKYIELLRKCSELSVTLVYNNIYNCPFETEEDIDAALATMEYLQFFPPPRLSNFRVSIGSEIMRNYGDYNIARLMPSKEASLYPSRIGESVGVLFSLNTGCEFEAQETGVDHMRLVEGIRQWQDFHSLGVSCYAHQAPGYVRIEYQVGDKTLHLDVTDEAMVGVLVACDGLSKRQSVYESLSEFSTEEVDAAIRSLQEQRLLFVEGNECVTIPIFARKRINVNKSRNRTIAC